MLLTRSPYRLFQQVLKQPFFYQNIHYCNLKFFSWALCYTCWLNTLYNFENSHPQTNASQLQKRCNANAQMPYFNCTTFVIAQSFCQRSVFQFSSIISPNGQQEQPPTNKPTSPPCENEKS